LSDYRDLLGGEEHYYAIELELDIETPPHFTSIDHHNDHQNEPSSLERILTLLDVPMNRFYRLVALNDRGYIPAMKAFGASEEEIAKIRHLDRLAQGVSEEEESTADRFVAELDGEGLLVIESPIEHFSPIVDRLFGRELLLYRGTKLTYYGGRVRMLVEKFPELIESGIAYFGGDDGFFGIGEGKLGSEEFLALKERIVQLLKKAPV
jgi:hypothetical protein